MVDNPGGIEDGDVREIAGLELTAAFEMLTLLIACAHEEDAAARAVARKDTNCFEDPFGATRGTLDAVDKAGNQRYTDLLNHDLRRSAMSGHKTRVVFGRHHIVDEQDGVAAMTRVQLSAKNKLPAPRPRLKP